jgi:hypothetical protein
VVRTLDKEERAVCGPSEIAQLYATLLHCVVAGSDQGYSSEGSLCPDLIHHVGYGLRRINLLGTSVNRGLLGWLLALGRRLGAQPQRYLLGLHRFPGHPHQVVAQCA